MTWHLVALNEAHNLAFNRADELKKIPIYYEHEHVFLLSFKIFLGITFNSMKALRSNGTTRV